MSEKLPEGKSIEKNRKEKRAKDPTMQNAYVDNVKKGKAA